MILAGPKHPGGRPRLDVDVEAALAMRARGEPWSEIEKALGVSRQTIQRAAGALGRENRKDPCPKLNTGPS